MSRSVGRSVGRSLNLRKFSYSAKTRSAFGLARNHYTDILYRHAGDRRSDIDGRTRVMLMLIEHCSWVLHALVSTGGGGGGDRRRRSRGRRGRSGVGQSVSGSASRRSGDIRAGSLYSPSEMTALRLAALLLWGLTTVGESIFHKIQT